MKTMTDRAGAVQVPVRPLIELAGVEKTYRTGRVEYPALRGVDLTIAPGEFAAAAPALLGFHPKGSLVAVFLREGRLTVTMRVDLPEHLAAFATSATREDTSIR